MSIIESLRNFIATCPLLTGQVNVDELDANTTNYSISPLSGGGVVKKDIIGNVYYEYPFSIMSIDYVTSDLERIKNAGFFEEFADWIMTAGLPILPQGKTATKLEVSSWGTLFSKEPDSDLGVYQILLKLYYNQKGEM